MKFKKVTQQILRCRVCGAYPESSETTTSWFNGATAYHTLLFCSNSHPRIETSSYFSVTKGRGYSYALDEWNLLHGQPWILYTLRYNKYSDVNNAGHFQMFIQKNWTRITGIGTIRVLYIASTTLIAQPFPKPVVSLWQWILPFTIGIRSMDSHEDN